MSLVDHARRELELLGEDPAYSASLVAAIAALTSFGHSGGSMMVATEQLADLLAFRPLTPLTADPEEWQDRSEMSSTPLWQSTRDSAAMSHDGGKTYYYVDDRTPQYGDPHKPTEAAKTPVS